MASNLVGRLARNLRSGEKHSIWNRPGLQAETGITVASPSFEDGGEIGLRHAGEGVGENLSPELRITGIPRGTAQLLLIIEDTDVPLPRPIIHTVALLDPAVTTIAEGALASGQPGITFVPAAFGRIGYAGPRPIPGHGPHRYGFSVFALDTEVRGESPKNLDTLLAAFDGKVLARGRITATLER